MNKEEAERQPLMTREMQDREFAVRLINLDGSLYYQQRMRDGDGNLVWVYVDHVVID